MLNTLYDIRTDAAYKAIEQGDNLCKFLASSLGFTFEQVRYTDWFVQKVKECLDEDDVERILYPKARTCNQQSATLS